MCPTVFARLANVERWRAGASNLQVEHMRNPKGLHAGASPSCERAADTWLCSSQHSRTVEQCPWLCNSEQAYRCTSALLLSQHVLHVSV
jgi:hypothetical protein